jgi:hypothetical protein
MVHSARRWDHSHMRHPRGNLWASRQQQDPSHQSLPLGVLLAFGPSRCQENHRAMRCMPTLRDKAPCTRIGAVHHTRGLALRAMGARPSGASTQVIMRWSYLPLSRCRQVFQVDRSSPSHQPRGNYGGQVPSPTPADIECLTASSPTTVQTSPRASSKNLPKS